MWDVSSPLGFWLQGATVCVGSGWRLFSVVVCDCACLLNGFSCCAVDCF